MSLRRFMALLAVAVAMTWLNALKPLTVDDAVNYRFAANISEHPLDPYGFVDEHGQAANTILVPPGFLYWWAASIRLFGQSVPLWKLWALPVDLLFVAGLHHFGRLFARGLEMPFVCMVAFSAAVLPCVNLMLDVPALALGLTAIAVFQRACAAKSAGGAVLAGAVAALAMQTKYTAFVAPGVMLLLAWQMRKKWLGLLAGVVALALFVGWEAITARLYGDSHFMFGYRQFGEPIWMKAKLLQPLFGTLGGVIAGAIPFAFAALGRPRWVVGLGVAVVALVFACLNIPDGLFPVYSYPKLIGALFGVLGVAFLWTIAVVAWNLLDRAWADDGSPAVSRVRSADAFLVGWLLLEIAGYFLLSPYPAARRVMAVVIVALLLAARLAARREAKVWPLVGFNALLGLLMFAADFNLHHGQKRAAELLAADRHGWPAEANTWYFGNGAFEFAADRLGMRKATLPEAAIMSGDRVLVVEEFQKKFGKHPVAARCVFVGAWEWRPWLPLRSEYQYGSAPASRTPGPLSRVAIYRVR